MRVDKEKATQLRLQGYSYNEISKKLSVPKATLSGWFSDLQLSDSARERINKRSREGSRHGLIKRNKLQTHKAKERARQNRYTGKQKIGKLTNRELLLVAAALYWGEGYKRPIVLKGIEKTQHPVSLSNTDPYLLRVFVKFLKEICEVEEKNIDVQIRLFEHTNKKEALEFWMKNINLPKTCFTKFYYSVSISSANKRPYNRLPYGTVQIRVNRTNLYHEIMGYIDSFRSIK